jgi:hypothetical protein
MSTDQHWNAPTEPVAESERKGAEQPPKEKKLDLSLTKVLGGALAAMTAAALGSRLSVAGTLVGAALASVIAAVAGSLYTASLSHTRDKVRTVWTGRSGAGQTPTELQTSTQVEAGATVAPARANAPRPQAQMNLSRRALPWKSVLAATLATFAVAAVLITGYELLTGHALSGGTGTTISQVGGGNTSPTPKPSSKASKTATPSPTPSSSTEPSSTPSATASSQPTPFTEPSSTVPTPTPTPSETPSPGVGAVSAGQGEVTPGGQ